MFRLMRLEDRIVLDGAAVLEADDHLDQDSTHDLYHMKDGDDVLLAADASDAASDGVHVLVISSDVADADDLAAAVKDGVIVIKYDATQTGLDELAAIIHDALGGQKGGSIAFASHNEGSDSLRLTSAETMSADNIQDYEAFWKTVGAEIADGGRIDLLACSVYESSDGAAFVSDIENISGVNVAASSDITGNEAYGGDWVLESDNVDVKATYFDADKLDDFDGVMSPPTPVSTPIISPVSLQPGTDTGGTWFSFQLSSYLGHNQPFSDIDNNLYTGDKNADWTAWWDDDPEAKNVLPHLTGTTTPWMAFRPATLSFYGMAPKDADGKTYTIAVKAVDDAGEYGIGKFQITFGGVVPTTGAEVNLSMNPVSFSEASGTSQVMATLSKALTTPVTVNFGFGGVAVKDTDYTASATSVIFNAGETAKSITLTGKDDLIQEGTESLQVTIASITGSATKGTTYQVAGSVLDNDSAGGAEVNLSMNPSSFSEAGVTSQVTATLSKALTTPVTVNFGFGGVAVKDADYTASATSVTFNAGETAKTITLTGKDDLLQEGTESLQVSISSINGNAVVGASSQVIGNILDDDVSGSAEVNLSMNPGSFSEAGVTSQVTATLSKALTTPVTVNFGFGGTAVKDIDYTASAASVTFNAGETAKTITLTGKDDLSQEGTESLQVSILSITGNAAPGAASQITGSVLDNDVASNIITLVKSQDTFTEDRTSFIEVYPVIGTPVSADTTVSFKFGGKAGAGEYYASSSTSIIKAGATKGSSLILLGNTDKLYELPEEVSLAIGSVTGGVQFSSTPIMVTLIDSDGMPSVTLDALTPGYLSEGQTAQLKATLSHPSDLGVTVSFAFSGDAQQGTGKDYTITPILIGAGNTVGSTILSALTDGAYEPNETLLLIADDTTITSGKATGGKQVAGATIASIDTGPEVKLTADKTTIDENGEEVVTVIASISKESFEDVIVGLDYSFGTAKPGVDFTAGPATLTIAKGETSASFTFSSLSDNIDEPNETIAVDISTLTSGSEAGGFQRILVTITDDDPQPTLNLRLPDATLAEADSEQVTLYADLSNASGLPIQVGLSFTGTAQQYGVDYEASAAVIDIPADATTGSITLTAKTDAIVEGDETFTVKAASITGGATLGTTIEHTATITETEGKPKVYITATSGTAPKLSVEEKDMDSVTAGYQPDTTNITVSLTKASAHPITVNLAFTGTAVLDADYTTNQVAQVSFASGVTTANIALNVKSDAVFEGNETFDVSIKDVSTAYSEIYAGSDKATITIVDDEQSPGITLTSDLVSVTEGNKIKFLANLTNATETDIKVNLSFSGTAETNGTDFTYAGTTPAITITKGTTTGNLELTTLNDSAYEGNETVEATMTNVPSGIVNLSGTNPHTITITDSQKAPLVTLSMNSTTFAEGKTATLTANLDIPNSENPVEIPLVFTGTAAYGTTNGTDDLTAPAKITVPVGKTSASIEITALTDKVFEGTEGFTVDVGVLAATSGRDGTGAPIPATITDTTAIPKVTLKQENLTLKEDSPDNYATVTASMDNANAIADVKVTLAFTGTAEAGKDYFFTAPEITIKKGETAGTLRLVTIPDNYEGVESFKVNISGVNDTAMATPDLVATSTYTIAETGTQPKVAISKVDIAPTGAINLNEDDPANSYATVYVDIVSGGAQKSNMTVEFNFSGSASFDTDYSTPGSTKTLTIAAGQTRGSFKITPVDDVAPAETPESETITVNIKSVTGGALFDATNSVTVSMTDDESPPNISLSFSSDKVAEGSTVKLIAKADNKYNGAVTVYPTFGGTATSASAPSPDYNQALTGAAISFNPYTTPTGGALDITIYTETPKNYEGDETITVSNVSVLNGKWVYPSTPLTTTIQEPAGDRPTISLFPITGTLTEGESTSLEARLSATYGVEFAVQVYFSGGTATLTDDYIFSNSGIISIPAGQTVGSMMFYALGDSVMEGSENVTITGASNNGANVSGTSININEGTAGPEVFLEVSTDTIAEDTGKFTLKASTNGQTVYTDTTINLTYAGATLNNDFTGASSIKILKGESSASIELAGKPDTSFEGNEVLDISISSVNPTKAVTDPASQHAKVTITDADDDKPTLSLYFDGSKSSINNETGTIQLTVDITNSRPYVNGDLYVDIDYSKISGASPVASYGKDFTGPSQIKIAQNASRGFITLSLIDDEYYENVATAGQELMTAVIGNMRLNATDGATAGANYGTTPTAWGIGDGDPQPIVKLAAAPTTINEKASPTSATLTAVLEGGKAETDVTVALNFTGTAQGGGADYSVYGVSQTDIVIPAGQTSATMTILAKTDFQYEDDETVKVSVVSAKTANNVEMNKTLATEQVITIKQEGGTAPPVKLQTTAGKFTEGGVPETITAVLDQTVGVETTVEFSFAGNASTDGTDYVSSATSVKIPAGQSSAFITLAGHNDGKYEGQETVAVGVKSMTFGTETRGGETVAVKYVALEDAQSAPKVTLSPHGQIGEGGLSALTATLDLPRQYGDVVVGLNFGGTAIYGTDYSAPTTLTIPAGQTYGTVPFTVLTDTLFENSETVIVDINNVTNGTENGTQQQTITIVNSGAVAISLTADPASVIEPDPGADKTVIFTVKKDAPTTEPVYVKWQTKDITATVANNDYVAGSGELWLGSQAGAYQTIPLTVKGDDIAETNEVVRLELTQVKLGTTNGTDLGTYWYDLTINNDDFVPTVVASTWNGAFVNEGGTGEINNTKLKATDLDHTNGADLTYTILTPFIHGSLYKDNGDGTFNATTDIFLGYGSKFTQAELDSTKFFYKHDGSDPTPYGGNDLMRFEVSDPAGQKALVGSSTTIDFKVPVQPIDGPPFAPNYVFYANEGVSGTNSVTVGAGGTGGAARVVGTDDTNPYDIRYYLVADSGHDGHFDIDSMTGVLTVKTGMELDYEGQDSYHFKVLLDNNGNITDGLDQSTTEILIIVGNSEPEPVSVINPIASQNPPSVDEGELFVWSFAENTFSNYGNATYTAEITNQGYLPNWLSFQAGSRTFYYLGGDIPLTGITSISISVTSTSPGGSSATDTFNLPLILGSLDLINAIDFMDADSDEFFVLPTESEDVEVMMYAAQPVEYMPEDADLAEILNLLDSQALTADSNQIQDEIDMPVIQADDRSIAARKEAFPRASDVDMSV